MIRFQFMVWAGLLVMSLALPGFANTNIGPEIQVNVLSKQFQSANQLSQSELEKVLKEDHQCQQYCLFKEGLLKVPSQDLKVLAQTGGKGFLRKTPEGDLIGEWSVPRVGENPLPSLVRSMPVEEIPSLRTQLLQNRLEFSRQPSGVDPERFIGFFLYCPKK